MRQKSRITGILFSFVLIIGLLLAWFNRIAIYDWLRLRNYQPSHQVVRLAVDNTMTDYAKHMFYVNHPKIENREEFNRDCPDVGGEKTIILGCYHGNQTGIFIYSIKDSRLDGIIEVTAAHETLHAIYERLSAKERAYINDLLQDFYKHKLTDKRILSTIESYKRTEPHDVINEMHSIFATEIDKLTPALETYYKKYFQRRSKVVGFAKKYQQVFINNQNLADKYWGQMKNIEKQLISLKGQIDSKKQDLATESSRLEVAQGQLNPSNVDDFNDQVRQYNTNVQALKAMIVQFNSLVTEYNSIAAKHQAITTDTNQLFKKLDSRSIEISTQ